MPATVLKQPAHRYNSLKTSTQGRYLPQRLVSSSGQPTSKDLENMGFRVPLILSKVS
jgi:hypothetical protein